MKRRRPPIPRIALTGGIGSGKSTVAGLFATLGVPVIDADVIARQVVEPGAPLLERIRERFGAGVITAAGALDRRALRNLVFGDADARADLNALMHPAIQAQLKQQAEAAQGHYALLVIPLLVETQVATAKTGPEPGSAGNTTPQVPSPPPSLSSRAERVLVVDCDPQLQLQRVRIRDGVTLEKARAALAAQASREARLAVADDVITNTGALAQLQAQVQALHQRYRTLKSRTNIYE